MFENNNYLVDELRQIVEDHLELNTNFKEPSKLQKILKDFLDYTLKKDEKTRAL